MIHQNVLNDDTVPGQNGRLYIIVWRHRTDYGSKGKGTKQFQLKEAAQLAQELNWEYPHIEHWAEPLEA